MKPALESTDVRNKLEDLSGITISDGENPYDALIKACRGDAVSRVFPLPKFSPSVGPELLGKSWNKSAARGGFCKAKSGAGRGKPPGRDRKGPYGAPVVPPVMNSWSRCRSDTGAGPIGRGSLPLEHRRPYCPTENE